jgi:hypothetical protein
MMQTFYPVEDCCGCDGTPDVGATLTSHREHLW